MSQGYSTKNATVKSVMHKLHFNMGYADAVDGKPFRNEYDNWFSNEQVNYERGRQFAVATNGGIAPKQGKQVRTFALYHMSKLVSDGAIL